MVLDYQVKQKKEALYQKALSQLELSAQLKAKLVNLLREILNDRASVIVQLSKHTDTSEPHISHTEIRIKIVSYSTEIVGDDLQIRK